MDLNGRLLRRGSLLLLLAVLICACAAQPTKAQEEADSPPPAGPEAEPPESDSETPTDEELPTVALELVAEGLSSPTTITHAGDGSGRLFIVEQPGRIGVLDSEGSELESFLDLSGQVSSGGERGLLGLAFHPDFPETPYLYVNYTEDGGDTVVSRFTVPAMSDGADPGSEQVLLTVPQPYANHNGGGLAFGPDGYLYISLGDGGSGGDPHDHGQNLETLLGTILRIDVDTGDPYAVPESNPFADATDAQAEIWAYGLRNPWRFSFDRETGDMWIADVGQNRWEEINLQPASSQGGENYGWNIMEGAHCFEPARGCEQEGLVLPVLEYDHSEGCSVTGGYRYRGQEIEGLRGAYIFGDYCSGQIWAARPADDGNWSKEPLIATDLRISAFGEDEAGELYVADHADGVVHKVVLKETR